MVLVKSVNKLLLAASASKARSVVVTWYFMFVFGLIYGCSSAALEWPREGPLFESDSNKRQGSKLGHYSSRLLGHYLSQAGGPWTDMAPARKP